MNDSTPSIVARHAHSESYVTSTSVEVHATRILLPRPGARFAIRSAQDLVSVAVFDKVIASLKGSFNNLADVSFTGLRQDIVAALRSSMTELNEIVNSEEMLTLSLKEIIRDRNARNKEDQINPLFPSEVRKYLGGLPRAVRALTTAHLESLGLIRKPREQCADGGDREEFTFLPNLGDPLIPLTWPQITMLYIMGRIAKFDLVMGCGKDDPTVAGVVTSIIAMATRMQNRLNALVVEVSVAIDMMEMMQASIFMTNPAIPRSIITRDSLDIGDLRKSHNYVNLYLDLEEAVILEEPPKDVLLLAGKFELELAQSKFMREISVQEYPWYFQARAHTLHDHGCDRRYVTTIERATAPVPVQLGLVKTSRLNEPDGRVRELYTIRTGSDLKHHPHWVHRTNLVHKLFLALDKSVTTYLSRLTIETRNDATAASQVYLLSNLPERVLVALAMAKSRSLTLVPVEADWQGGVTYEAEFLFIPDDTVKAFVSASGTVSSHRTVDRAESVLSLVEWSTKTRPVEYSHGIPSKGAAYGMSAEFWTPRSVRGVRMTAHYVTGGAENHEVVKVNPKLGDFVDPGWPDDDSVRFVALQKSYASMIDVLAARLSLLQLPELNAFGVSDTMRLYNFRYSSEELNEVPVSEANSIFPEDRVILARAVARRTFENSMIHLLGDFGDFQAYARHARRSERTKQPFLSVLSHFNARAQLEAFRLTMIGLLRTEASLERKAYEGESDNRYSSIAISLSGEGAEVSETEVTSGDYVVKAFGALISEEGSLLLEALIESYC